MEARILGALDSTFLSFKIFMQRGNSGKQSRLNHIGQIIPSTFKLKRAEVPCLPTSNLAADAVQSVCSGAKQALNLVSGLTHRHVSFLSPSSHLYNKPVFNNSIY